MNAMQCCALAMGCILGWSARADLPITVEDILTAQDRIRLGVSTRYANRQFDLGPAGFVENQDRVSLEFSARYGLSLDTELAAVTSFTYIDDRGAFADERFSDSTSYWDQLDIGLSHQFSADGETPALVIFGEITAAQRAARFDSSIVHGRQVAVGAIIYRTLDPLLLSGVAVIGYSGGTDINGIEVREGYSLQLEPQVSFVVNRKVTLTGGFGWHWFDKPKLDGATAGINRTETSLALGLGYKINPDLTFSAEGTFPMTSDSGASFRFELIYLIDGKL